MQDFYGNRGIYLLLKLLPLHHCTFYTPFIIWIPTNEWKHVWQHTDNIYIIRYLFNLVYTN